MNILNNSAASPWTLEKLVSTDAPKVSKPKCGSRFATVLIRCLAASVSALFTWPVISSAAIQITCEGTVTVVPILSSLQVTEEGTQMIVSFDFTGTHPFCFPNGSEVTANIRGHMVQHLADNGLTLEFDEILSYGGDSLGFRGEASLSGDNWQSHVQSVGQGTGRLAGVSAQGSFFPTADPTVLTDVLFYVFH